MIEKVIFSVLIIGVNLLLHRSGESRFGIKKLLQQLMILTIPFVLMIIAKLLFKEWV